MPPVSGPCLVAVLQAFVVLAGGQRQHVLAVDHDDEAGFLAEQAFLDHHAVAGLAHAVAGEHGVDSGVRLLGCRRDDHALAGGQSVGLHHDGRAVLVDVDVCRGSVGEGAEGRGGNAVARHELLGKILGAFELGGGLRGAEYLQSGGAEGIDHACRQRRFGAYHGEGDVLVAADKLDQRGDFRQWHVDESVFGCGAAITGRDEHLRDTWRLREFPRQCVFASARADD